MNGTIARLISDKGFGFIKGGDGRELFFHRTAVRNNGFENLREGQSVSYEEEPSSKGPRATNVTES